MADNPKDNVEARRRKDLAEFLRSKRAALKPGDFGLPTSRRRRAPGLLREELAQISGIGITWYTWLEQGRDIQVSTDLLQRLTRALRLSPHDAAYLFSLAAHPAPEVREPLPGIAAMLQVALDGYSAGPAFVGDEIFDVLAFNHVGNFIYRFDDYDGPRPRNHYWRLFMDPYRRGIHVSWPEWAEFGVGILRAQYASHLGNKKLEKLVEDLLAASPDFRQLWDASKKSGTSSYSPGIVQFKIPGFGTLNFLSLRLKIITNPDWLVVLLIPADDKTATAVREINARRYIDHKTK
jgi:transcriptional regulator with XRE-family HTH domain